MNMNTMSIALATALLSLPAANASEFAGAYAGANIGYNKNTPTSAVTSNNAYLGLQAGYNWEMNNSVVLGLEGFVDGHSKSVTSNDVGADVKAGYEMGNLMPYARLGLAATQPGTRAHGGLGLEYSFAPQWSMFGEVTADSKSVNNVTQKNTNFGVGVSYYFDQPAAAVATPVVMKKATFVVAPVPAVVAPAPVVVAPIVALSPTPKTIFTDKPITIEGASFDSGSAKLKPAANKQLEEVVDFAAQYKDANLTVDGYTDSQGKESANKILSVKRAESVKAYLVNRGIDAKRIATAGNGSAKAIGDNKTAAGRAMNRRVEINSVIRVAK